MKKIIKKVYNKIGKERLIIIFLVIVSLFPLYLPGFLYTHDRNYSFI